MPSGPHRPCPRPRLSTPSPRSLSSSLALPCLVLRSPLSTSRLLARSTDRNPHQGLTSPSLRLTPSSFMTVATCRSLRRQRRQRHDRRRPSGPSRREAKCLTPTRIRSAFSSSQERRESNSSSSECGSDTMPQRKLLMSSPSLEASTTLSIPTSSASTESVTVESSLGACEKLTPALCPPSPHARILPRYLHHPPHRRPRCHVQVLSRRPVPSSPRPREPAFEPCLGRWNIQYWLRFIQALLCLVYWKVRVRT